MESRRLILVSSALSAAFLLFWFVVWAASAPYAFGAAWFSLLSGLVLFTTARNIANNEVTLHMKRQYSKVLLCAVGLALILTFLAFFFVAAHPTINGGDRFLKPIFILFCFATVLGFAVTLIKLPVAASPTADFLTRVISKQADTLHKSGGVLRTSQKIDDAADSAVEMTTEAKSAKEKAESLGSQRESRFKCRECCRECCIVTLFLLISLASIYCIVDFTRTKTYFSDFLDDEGRFFADSNAEDSDQEMAFRCVGEGEPLVLFWHGYSGQALDFAHVFPAVGEVTKSCTFSRSGYGQSRVFGDNKRVSERLAIEAEFAFQQLGFTGETIFVGHSMAGLNMRAYDAIFPGRISAMVMVDPVDPLQTRDCFEGGIDISSILDRIGARLADSGLLLIMEMLQIQNAFAPIDKLPENVQAEYTANILRTDWFQTSTKEGQNWGESCGFVLENHEVPVDYPLTVIIPEKGIYDGEIDNGLNIANISTNGRAVPVLGENAFHVDMLFREEFAQVVVAETLTLVETLRAESSP